MNRAEQTKSALNNNQMSWTELLEEADEVAEAYEQDFDSEITWFEYPDGSVACFSGMDQGITTYGSRN